ncbi:MAG TPA: hypothetical protein VFI29_01995, partial [Hanamia sp.]|nr:hypothetical protein [Hanamia sp.]
KKLKGNKVNLLLHCHEYTSPENYNDMWLVQKMHKMETKMYPVSYVWISHTNEVRLEQFKKDHDLENVNKNIFHVMPNYPSRSWSSFKTDFGSTDKTRIVFVGSLGYDNMYLQETVDWVELNKDCFSLDIYAYNIDKKAKNLLDSINNNCINHYQGFDYKELPFILKKYDIGLVLYKPYNFNHVNGVSNKVFEYLACDLDVWFPKDNTYMLSMVREKSYPKILGLDFTNLPGFDFKNALKRDGMDYHSDNFFYETIYKEIYENMATDSK